MKRGNWFDTLSAASGTLNLPESTRDEFAKLDDQLFAIWNLGENVLLGWTTSSDALLLLSVRHHVIPEYIHAGSDASAWTDERQRLINDILSRPKHLKPEEFHRVRNQFSCKITAVRVGFRIENEQFAALVSDLVRRYSVSLVSNRAVLLLDVVGFSLQSPLDQLSTLNSLAYSVNSAYGQLLSKDIKIDFARTTTGDGFYIWNRGLTYGANAELYKLMMMILADNAIARRKASSQWVPQLRAAFHVGEHYEFHQVEGVNPTTFSYIVGQVTVDLARMLEGARPGQILVGHFLADGSHPASDHPVRYDTPTFVENTAETLDQLNGLEFSGGRITQIRCYLTGAGSPGGQFTVNRYYLRDKHSTTRAVYNARISIHCHEAESIYLGTQHDDLQDFKADSVESLSRDATATDSASVTNTGSLLVRR